jgi:hypothetical protein
MGEIRTRFGLLALLCCLAFIVAAGTGCPRWLSDGSAKVTTVFTTDSNALKTALVKALVDEKAVVDVNDIESLTVSLDGITLDREGEEDDGDEGDEVPEDTSEKAKVEIYGGTQDINLMDLMDLTEVLSSVEVSAGTYTKIRLQISDPRLVLTSDPETVITDVHLTANDNLFIGKTFTLEDGEQSILLLDFGGIHLTTSGNGSYVLTPQLQADLTLLTAPATSTGEIADLKMDADTFTLLLADGELVVDYSTAQIFLDTDTDTATGTEAYLADGLMVDVSGELQVDGSVIADSVRILPAGP